MVLLINFVDACLKARLYFSLPSSDDMLLHTQFMLTDTYVPCTHVAECRYGVT